MQFPFPFIDELTIPTDAGPTDDRIVISGVTGTISIYQGATLIGSVSPSNGFRMGPIGAFEAYAQIDVFGTTAGVRLGDNRMVEDAFIRASQLAVATPALILDSPSDDHVGTPRSRIAIEGEDSDNAIPMRINLTGENGGSPGDEGPIVAINQKEIGLGILYLQEETSNDGAHTADADTDFLISNAKVIAGHTYAFHLHTWVNLSAAVGDWKLRLRVNGTDTGLLGYVQNTVATSENRMVDGTCLWTASATASTDDFLVRADEVAGTADLTLLATADQPRTFSMTDLGVLL